MYSNARFLAALALAGLAGCVSVDAQNIKNFGDAAKAVATAAQDARAIDNKIVADIATESQATKFVRKDGSYQFPVKSKVTKLVGREWDIRIAYAQALADYGYALAAAASGVQSDDIETAIGNLKDATKTVKPGLSSQANFGAVSDAVGKAATTVITQAAYQRIHAAIVRAHPYIVKGSAILSGDFAEVADQVRDRYGNWLIAKTSALKEIRRSSSGSEKYQTYRAFLQDEKDMKASIALLVVVDGDAKPGYQDVLDKMVKAHAALAETTPNIFTINAFVEAARQFKALSDSLHKDQAL